MKAIEQYVPVVLFIMLWKVVLIFESVDEILKSDHSNESYRAVLSCGAVYYAVQGGSDFWVCGWIPQVWPFKWKLLSSTILWCCLLRCAMSVDETLTNQDQCCPVWRKQILVINATYLCSSLSICFARDILFLMEDIKVTSTGKESRSFPTTQKERR